MHPALCRWPLEYDLNALRFESGSGGPTQRSLPASPAWCRAPAQPAFPSAWLSQGQMTSFLMAWSLDSPVPVSSESIRQVPLSTGTSILIWKKFVTLLAFSRGSCWPPSPRGCTFPWDTEGHLGESLAKTGEAKQPRLRSLLKDRAMRALGGVLGSGRGQGQSLEASLVSPSEGPWRELEPQASRFCSEPEPEEPSKAILMGEGQMAMLGRLMKRLGEGKGFRGERQDGEKGPDGDGGAQVPVYTARWGLGAVCWPGCRQGDRELRVS